MKKHQNLTRLPALLSLILILWPHYFLCASYQFPRKQSRKYNRRPLFYLKKAGLNADDVWFCGDNIKADIEGAAAIDIFPVWYEDETLENPWIGQENAIAPNCDHLHIHDWMELIEVLERID